MTKQTYTTEREIRKSAEDLAGAEPLFPESHAFGKRVSARDFEKVRSDFKDRIFTGDDLVNKNRYLN